jgi:hypothetical protein
MVTTGKPSLTIHDAGDDNVSGKEGKEKKLEKSKGCFEEKHPLSEKCDFP